jgi:hypothetical protein
MEKLLNRLSRLAPLTGLAFIVLAAAGAMTSAGAPSAQARGAAVVAFYKANSLNQQVSDTLWTLGFAAFLLFAGSLAAYLRATPAAHTLSSLVLPAAAVLVAGATVYFGFDYTLAADASNLDPAAAQALNAPALFLLLPVSAGGLVFGLASGLAILRGARLPKWLGWVALAAGIFIGSPLGIAGVVALALWTPIVSVLVFRRSGALDAA